MSRAAPQRSRPGSTSRPSAPGARHRGHSKATTATLEPEAASDRKHRLLSSSTASRVPSISDAVNIKDGSIFLVCRPDGQIPGAPGDGHGIYFHDCRFLSTYQVDLGGSWDVLGSAVPGERVAVIHTCNPELEVARQPVPKQTLVATWTRTLDGGSDALQDVILIHNHGTEAVELPVRIRVASDFRDMFAVRDLLTDALGSTVEPSWKGRTVTLRYEGSDHVERITRVGIDHPLTGTAGSDADLTLHLPAGDAVALGVRVEVQEHASHDSPGSSGRPGAATQTRGRHTDGGWLDSVTQIETSDPRLATTIRRALLDLRSLRSSVSGDQYFAAGIPWFVALFGRDSLITAEQVLILDPGIAAETLKVLASRQGTDEDAWRDEAPGKILHELRVGEFARTGRIPQTPYYGSVDSTPLFLVLLVHHAQWTGDLSLFEELRPAVDRALGWIDGAADVAGDGYVSYRSRSDHGLANQGWKDSGNAIVRADGSIAEPPISLVEVQAYVFAAKAGLADLFERSGDHHRAASLRSEAERLRARFEHDFWMDDERGYALALQGDRSLCDVITSNPGHALWAGIASAAHGLVTARLLMQDRMFTGWGVRCFAEGQTRYNPVGYHLGTVWPHDNALIAAGLRAYGEDAAALAIATGLFAAAAHFPDERLPEVFGGFPRQSIVGPVRYPVACHPQAWAAGSVPSLLTTILGLRPAGLDGVLRICRPTLPPEVAWLRLRDLHVGGGRIDLLFRRSGSRVEVRVERVDGAIQILVEDAPDGEPARVREAGH